MEKENLKQKQQNTNFENLKKLSGLLNSPELSSFVGAIGKAKKSLDAFCKMLKEKEAEIIAKPVKEEVKEVVQPQQTQNISFTPSNNVRRPERVERPIGRQPQAQRPAGQNQRAPFAPKPFGPRAQQGQAPFDRNQQGTRPMQKPAGARPFARPVREEPDTLVVKQERSFGNKNKTKTNDSEKKELSIKAKLRMGYIEMDDMGVDEERIGRVRKVKKQKETVAPEKTEITNAVITSENLTVKMLSEKMGKPASEIIKKFMMLGMMLNINSPVDFATAELVASEFGITLEQKVDKKLEEKLEEMFNEPSAINEKRPPIVTVMGHVDHGKTSLLDYIKKSHVTQGEAGGITQHIGAYSVEVNKNKITFIDTPGHEAFTAMRQRGAQVTDIAILVVAADDGIMPQTIEAINHIKAANVPMIVAINKMDKPTANPERIKQQLTEHEVLPEEWGGDTICVPISAHTGLGIDKLLEMVLLVADMQELSADPTRAASGYVLESSVDKGKGVNVTVVVRDGTLKVGDFIISGVAYGKVRAMNDYKGATVKSANPSMAVSVLGFNVVPDAGEKVYVVDEKLGKSIVEERVNKQQEQKINAGSNVTLEDFLAKSADKKEKTLNLIVKADVKGSSEAIKQSLEKITNEEVTVKVIHSAVGAVNESDILLASTSGAIIIAFNVRPDSKAKTLAERNGVEIKTYRIIYDAIDDVTNAINGMLTPKFEEKIMGHAEIRHVFKISSVGTIAGSYVLDGSVNRGDKVRLLRSNIIIAETEIEGLQIQKDEAKTVKAGYECGIKLRNYTDIKEGDIIETFEMVQI